MFNFWTKVAWWAFLAAGNGGMVDNIKQSVDTCSSCVTDEQSPTTDCQNGLVDLLKMSITNITKGVVGWMCGYSGNWWSPVNLATVGVMTILILLILMLKIGHQTI